MLTDAVRASGWVAGLNALEGTEDVDSEPSSDDDGDGEERFESALRSVAALFTIQVSQKRRDVCIIVSYLHF